MCIMHPFQIICESLTYKKKQIGINRNKKNKEIKVASPLDLYVRDIRIAINENLKKYGKSY